MAIAFLRSTVGKKFLMGISAAIWAGFVLGHMAGNLVIFFGKDAYNTYGHFASAPPLIYVIESLLVLAFLVHVYMATALTIGNRRAKNTGYNVRAKGAKSATIASRTMGAQGLLILFFLIFHLMTFKFGPYYETTVNGVVMRDLAGILFEVFHNYKYVLWYCICLLILGLHLSHGVGSIFLSLGLLQTERHVQLSRKLSKTYAVIVLCGFLSLPIYIYSKDLITHITSK